MTAAEVWPSPGIYAIAAMLDDAGASRNQRSNTTLIGRDAEYIRARLKRDGHDALLAQVERGEKSANAAAVEMGWRARMVQVPATVEGFTRAILSHLSPLEQAQVIDGIGRPLAVAPTKKRRAI